MALTETGYAYPVFLSVIGLNGSLVKVLRGNSDSHLSHILFKLFYLYVHDIAPNLYFQICSQNQS